MAVESFVYTRRPPLAWADLAAAAEAEGWHLRRLDAAGPSFAIPIEASDDPIAGCHLVIVSWPVGDEATTAEVDRAIRDQDRAAIERLGAAGRLASSELTCRPYSFEQVSEQELAIEDEDEDEGDEPSAPPVDVEQFRGVQARYSGRCATRPGRNGDLLARINRLIIARADGFAFKW